MKSSRKISRIEQYKKYKRLYKFEITKWKKFWFLENEYKRKQDRIK